MCITCYLFSLTMQCSLVHFLETVLKNIALLHTLGTEKTKHKLLFRCAGMSIS